MAVNYVKFMRGTQAQYDGIVNKNSDTLYFVYDSVNAEKGKLYLGTKLISGSSSASGSIFIGDIEDVVLGTGLTDGQVLMYNEATGKWENRSLQNVVSIMQGATASTAGTSGLVPVPQAGDQGKFLRGDGTWAIVQSEDVSDLRATVTTLVGTDTNKSVATIVTEKVAELLIPGNAKESLDTLVEIADWIQGHPDDAAAMNQSIVNNTTKISNLEALLQGDNGLEARVSNLETTMGTFTPVQGKYVNVGSAIGYLNLSVDELNERLRWHELADNPNG